MECKTSRNYTNTHLSRIQPLPKQSSSSFSFLCTYCSHTATMSEECGNALWSGLA